MAFWEIVTIGAIGALIRKGIKNAEERAEEERRRKNTPCGFTDGISREQFELIAKEAGRHIKRLIKLSVDGPVVYGTVRTQSGLSEWDFKVDFNDYGHITGKYWLSSDNDDSNIPGHVADNMSTMIASFPKDFSQNASGFFNNYTNEEFDEEEDPAAEQERLRKTKEQAELFQKRKKERTKRKIRLVFALLIIVAISCIGMFGWYKYQEFQKRIEVGFSKDEIIGLNYEDAISTIKESGFTNVYAHAEYDLGIEDIKKEYIVTDVSIRGDSSFEDEDKYPYDARVELIYHVVKSIHIPVSAKDGKKMLCDELVSTLEEAGFVNITTEADRDLITGWITKEGSVEEISIGGDTKFSQNASFRPDVEIVITYHAFKEK